MPHVSSGVITAKGTKGLLQWIQAKMPNFYDVLSPKLMATAMGSLGCARINALGAVYRGDFRARHQNLVAMGTLGDTTDFSSYTNTNMPTISDYGVNSVVTQPDFVAIDSGPTTSTSAANYASSSPTSGSTASIIGAVAQGVATGTLAYGEVQANNTLLAANIARANAGLAPLGSTGTATSLFGSTSSSTLLLLAAAAVGAYVLMGSKKSAS